MTALHFDLILLAFLSSCGLTSICVVKYDKAQCDTLCFVVGSSFPEKWLHWKKKSIKVAISKVNQSMLRCGTLFKARKTAEDGQDSLF